MTTTILEALNAKTAKDLVGVFNRITGQSVKRFATKSAGLKRISKAITDADVAKKLDALLGIEGTTVTVITEFDDGSPMESAGEAITRGIKKGAKPVKPKPITVKGNKLVSYKGKTVRPENTKRLDKGEALWGALSAAPSEKDQIKGAYAKVNLNYPAKDHIVPMREGTMRAQLIKLMTTKKGVTIEQVAKLFNIPEAAAVYKIRDLHYVGGHGLRVVKGRVFAYEG